MRRVRIPERGEILRARGRLARHVAPSPLARAETLGEDVWLVLESLQPTGSFKVRGAFSALTAAGTEPVVTASTGNHALALAYAARVLGASVTVVCPETASPAKLGAIRRLRATLVVHGGSFDEAEAHALELADGGMRFISACNDPDVIAGQGTIGSELSDKLGPNVTVVSPAGGGGLVAGLGLWASGVPGMRVVGVQTEAAPSLRDALVRGAIVPLAERPTLADGLAGSLEPGSVTVELVRRHVDDVVLVGEEEIAEAMRFLVRNHGLVAEGAGATALAAVLAGRVGTPGAVAILVTGRNVSLDVLARVLAAA